MDYLSLDLIELFTFGECPEEGPVTPSIIYSTAKDVARRGLCRVENEEIASALVATQLCIRLDDVNTMKPGMAAGYAYGKDIAKEVVKYAAAMGKKAGDADKVQSILRANGGMRHSALHLAFSKQYYKIKSSELTNIMQKLIDLGLVHVSKGGSKMYLLAS
jgi:hypothetical protein